MAMIGNTRDYSRQECCLGMRVMMKPVKKCEGDTDVTALPGTVVWIHPKGRFALVEFDSRARECYQLVHGCFLGLNGWNSKEAFVKR